MLAFSLPDKKIKVPGFIIMRVGIADNLLVGIVTGVPISRESERFSTFLRLIYEPGHKKHG